MLGLIAFLLIDLGMSLYQKDKDRAQLLFRTVLILGVCTLVFWIRADMLLRHYKKAFMLDKKYLCRRCHKAILIEELNQTFRLRFLDAKRLRNGGLT